jgi:hypothetical protein
VIGSSKRWASSELEGKSRFKEAFMKFDVVYSSWNFNKSLIQSLWISSTYPSLSLATSGFHRLDSFLLVFFRLDVKSFPLKI